MKRQISSGVKPSTIAEEAVDQLQENEKLVAGKWFYPCWANSPIYTILYIEYTLYYERK